MQSPPPQPVREGRREAQREARPGPAPSSQAEGLAPCSSPLSPPPPPPPPPPLSGSEKCPLEPGLLVLVPPPFLVPLGAALHLPPPRSSAPFSIMPGMTKGWRWADGRGLLRGAKLRRSCHVGAPSPAPLFHPPSGSGRRGAGASSSSLLSLPPSAPLLRPRVGDPSAAAQPDLASLRGMAASVFRRARLRVSPPGYALTREPP